MSFTQMGTMNDEQSHGRYDKCCDADEFFPRITLTEWVIKLCKAISINHRAFTSKMKTYRVRTKCDLLMRYAFPIVRSQNNRMRINFVWENVCQQSSVLCFIVYLKRISCQFGIYLCSFESFTLSSHTQFGTPQSVFYPIEARISEARVSIAIMHVKLNLCWKDSGICLGFHIYLVFFSQSSDIERAAELRRAEKKIIVFINTIPESVCSFYQQ